MSTEPELQPMQYFVAEFSHAERWTCSFSWQSEEDGFVAYCGAGDSPEQALQDALNQAREYGGLTVEVSP